MFLKLKTGRQACLTAAIAVLSSLTIGNAMAAEKLRLGHGLQEDHPVHLSMKRFADLVKQKSNGDIEIKIFANGTLGSEREMLEQVQNGVLEITKASASPLETFAQEYKVFNLPFVFRDRDHFFKVLEGPIGEAILASSKAKGFVGLTFYDAGPRSFYAKKPINTPEDLKGMKIRVQQSPTTIKMISALGASPTPMPYGEVYTALQTGVIDGAENNVSALTIGRHGEVAKFYSDTEHQMVPDVLLFSMSKWESLNKAQQDILRQAARESLAYEKKLWADYEKGEQIKAEKMGVKFSSPNKASFVAKVKPMIDEERKNAKIAAVLVQIAATK